MSEYSSILKDIHTALNHMSIPIETGTFSDEALDTYLVLTPMTDQLELYADNQPQQEIQEVRISLFSKNNYLGIKNQIVKSLLLADFTITGGRFIGYEKETKFFHYVIDVLKEYELSING